jgi:hypothetical protein
MMGPASGTVIAYNFSTDNYIGDITVMSMFTDLHDAGVSYNLFEGNDGSQYYADVFHGSTDANTFFRNHLSGFDVSGATPKSDATTPAKMHAYNRYYNIIGNVMGQTGIQSVYESFAPGNVNDTGVIFSLGDGNSEGSVVVPQDTTVRQTLMRWGNYDVVNGAAEWNSGEVPSGLTDGLANPVPASHTLPNSFFLTSKPNWWPTSKPWPPIGPDVTGGNISGLAGHAYTIPAYDCYVNVMGGNLLGTSGVLTFTPNSCYTLSTAPAAPSNLKAVVQ